MLSRQNYIKSKKNEWRSWIMSEDQKITGNRAVPLVLTKFTLQQPLAYSFLTYIGESVCLFQCHYRFPDDIENQIRCNVSTPTCNVGKGKHKKFVWGTCICGSPGVKLRWSVGKKRIGFGKYDELAMQTRDDPWTLTKKTRSFDKNRFFYSSPLLYYFIFCVNCSVNSIFKVYTKITER